MSVLYGLVVCYFTCFRLFIISDLDGYLSSILFFKVDLLKFRIKMNFIEMRKIFFEKIYNYMTYMILYLAKLGFLSGSVLSLFVNI